MSNKDVDLDLLFMDENTLRQEVMKLRNAIRRHRDQKGDDNCWLDYQDYLYVLLPEKTPCEPQLPEKPLMMLNCERYYECRKAGKVYHPLTEMPDTPLEVLCPSSTSTSKDT